MTKNKNIPEWQKSIFDIQIKNSNVECVKTKPILTSAIKKMEKDFFDQNFHKMKVKDPELFKYYKKEFGIKNKSKINKNDTKRNNTKKINNNGNIKKIVARDEADQKLSDIKTILGKDLKDKDQSMTLNQNNTNSDDELRNYLEQKK